MRTLLWTMLLAGCGDAVPGADQATFPVDGGALDLPISLFDSSPSQDDAASPDAAQTAQDAAQTAQADALVADPGCQVGMVRIHDFCVDRWEAHVVELDGSGNEMPHSPYQVVAGLSIRAKTAPNQAPQAYISQLEATRACNNAGKRLCSAAEFALACRGASSADHYPYGGTLHIQGSCNEGKGSSMTRFFGNDPNKWTYAEFNDPRLNQWDGGLAPTAAYPLCVSPYGVYDCVGNLHEWGSDGADAKGHGRFRGGFYGDAEANGPGCLYVTSAHELAYHDYSTGFRCCMDATH